MTEDESLRVRNEASTKAIAAVSPHSSVESAEEFKARLLDENIDVIAGPSQIADGDRGPPPMDEGLATDQNGVSVENDLPVVVNGQKCDESHVKRRSPDYNLTGSAKVQQLDSTSGASELGKMPLVNGVTSDSLCHPKVNGICEEPQPSCSREGKESVDGRHKCPHAGLFFDAAYPDFPQLEREKVEELVIDDMSLVLFKTMDDYLVFKKFEDVRKAKVESLNKLREEEELIRLATLKKEKQRSKHDALKEKQRERDRQLKEQRAQEREARKELRERERMRHFLPSNEKKLTKKERIQWKADRIHRNRERAERRAAKEKRRMERTKLKKPVGESSPSRLPNGGSVGNSDMTALTSVTPTSSIASSSAVAPSSSRVGASGSALMNEFRGPNIAMEALAQIANMSSGGGSRLKRPAEDAGRHPNGVIFSPTYKMPKLDPARNVKSEAGLSGTTVLSSIFNAEKSSSAFDAASSASGVVSTPNLVTNSTSSHLPSIAVGTPKAVATAATLFTNMSSNNHHREIEEVFNTNPQFAFLFSSAISTLRNAASDSTIELRNGTNDVKLPLPISSIGSTAAASIGISKGAISVNAITSSPKSTLNLVNRTNAPTPSVAASSSTTFTPNHSTPKSTTPAGEVARPTAPNVKLPTIGIQFPPDAALGPKLAGAAILGVQLPTSSTAPSLKNHRWHSKHISIAQQISQKADKAKSTPPATQTIPETQRSAVAVTSVLAMPPASQNIQAAAMLSSLAKAVPQTPNVAVRPPPSATPAPAQPPPLTATPNPHLLKLQQMLPNPAMHQWAQMLPRFPAPLQMNGAPGITTGIPPPQMAGGISNEMAAQELAKLQRQYQKEQQNQQASSRNATTRPSSRMEARCTSVAAQPGVASQAAISSANALLLAQTPNHFNVSSATPGSVSQATNGQHSFAALFAQAQNAAQTQDPMLRMLSVLQQQHVQAVQASHVLQQQQQAAAAARLSAPLPPNMLHSLNPLPNVQRPGFNNLFNILAQRERAVPISPANMPFSMAPFMSDGVNCSAAANSLAQQFRPQLLEQQNQCQQFLVSNTSIPNSVAASTASVQRPDASSFEAALRSFDLNAQFLAMQQQQQQTPLSTPAPNSMLHAQNAMLRSPFPPFLANPSAAALNMQQFNKLSFPFPPNGAKRDP